MKRLMLVSLLCAVLLCGCGPSFGEGPPNIDPEATLPGETAADSVFTPVTPEALGITDATLGALLAQMDLPEQYTWEGTLTYTAQSEDTRTLTMRQERNGSLARLELREKGKLIRLLLVDGQTLYPVDPTTMKAVSTPFAASLSYDGLLGVAGFGALLPQEDTVLSDLATSRSATQQLVSFTASEGTRVLTCTIDAVQGVPVSVAAQLDGRTYYEFSTSSFSAEAPAADRLDNAVETLRQGGTLS